MKHGIGALLLALLATKLWLAWQMDLYADEVFYYQCGLRPALAFADLPPLTAIMVRAGTWLGGAHPFAVRLPFLFAGLALPMVIYFIAREVTNKRLAMFSAAMCFLVPGYAFLSIFAIPDVLLALETGLFILCFERATRTEKLQYWLGLGVVAGLGLLTHYRFVTAIAVCLLYLVLAPKGRALLRRSGIWLAGLVALPGLLPALVYNWQHDFQPLRYFLLTRHDRQIRPQAWLDHLVEQMMVVSPLLWVFLIATLWVLIQRARRGDDRALLFALFAAVPLGLFFLASPLQTTGAQSFHWALPGYIALLIYLPEIMTHFISSAGGSRKKLVLVVMAPAIAVVILVTAYLELGTGWLGIRGFREPFMGWSPIVAATHETLASLDHQGIQPEVLVAGNYKLGGQLELAAKDFGLPIYILDHSKNYEHGRQLQFDQWGIGEQALRAKAGAEALVLVQWSELAGSRDNWQKHLDWVFQPLESVGQFHFKDNSHSDYDKKVTFYLGTVIEKR